EAKKSLERAAELNANMPALRLNLGAVYWRLQDTGAAIAEWRKELAAHPESFQANYTLGAALALSSAGDEASRLLRKAVALKPGNAPAWYHLAKLVWQQAKGARRPPCSSVRYKPIRTTAKPLICFHRCVR